MSKQIPFRVAGITLMLLPLLSYHFLNTPLFDSLSDFVYFLIYDCTQVLGGILGIALLWNYGFREMFRYRFKWSYLLWILAIFILQYLWTQVVMSYIVSIYGDDSLVAWGQSYKFLSILGFSRYFYNSVFRAPFVEEVFYRGIAFSLLSKFKKYHLDLVVSSAIFSSAHFWYWGWSNMDFLNYFIPGLLLGAYFKKTNCIYYTMFYHMLWNAFPYMMGWR